MLFKFSVVFITLLVVSGIVLAKEGEPYCITNTFMDFGSPLVQKPMPNPGPPPDPDVGDSWDWYLWYFSGGPPHYEIKPCTVRGKGEHCYIIVDDEEWNVSIFQSDVDAIMDYFDNESVGEYPDMGIYDLNTTNFGEPPDSDGLSRIFLVWYDIDVADGFFWWFDQYPDGEYDYASNECDCVYMDCVDSDPGGEYMNAVCAHEFQHMIHWRWDKDEDAWVDEGCAELAMWLFGHPDTISGFNGNPDDCLTSWNGYYSDYVKVYLWTLYLFEHYGEYAGNALINTLVHEPANSIQGVNNALDDVGVEEDFVDIFKDWVVANYLDDISIYEGQYGYETENLPHFHEYKTWDEYPTDWHNSTLNHWAGEYVKFISNGLWYNLLLEFNGADSTEYALRTIWMDGDSSIQVVDMELNDSNDGELNIPDFGYDYQTVIMVPEGIASSGSTGYSYSADAGGEYITLKSFSAENADDGIVLKWVVASNEQFKGFNLYRTPLIDSQSHSLDKVNTTGIMVGNKAEYTKVNGEIITGSNPFSYMDRGVRENESYVYVLEVVIDDDSRENLGDVRVNREPWVPTSFGITMVYPNPASETISCLLNIPEVRDIEIDVYDISGRLVLSKVVDICEKGEVEAKIDVSELQSGVYTIHATQVDAEAIARVVVSR